MAYDLNPVRAPRLRGFALRAMTWLVECPGTRWTLLPSLLRSTGVSAFRRRTPEADPVALPLVRTGKVASEGAGNEKETIERVFRSCSEPREISPKGFRFVSIGNYVDAYRKNEIDPVAMAARLSESIEESNRGDRPLRSLIETDTGEVQRQWEESARRWREGNPRSLLEGVPVSIKDEFDMQGYSTRVGTNFLGEKPARSDATIVNRLRTSGAVLAGKTNMFEIGISPTGDNPNHGFARNPYDLDHDAGGSSGGAASSVASGLVPLAIGADGGGSIRVPASHCGVFGLKPTFGRVSESGAAPLCWSVAHIGPIGATALDTAIGLAAIAGPDARDPHSLAQPPQDWSSLEDLDLSGRTIGIYPEWFEHASPDIVEKCRWLVGRFEESGATVREISIEGLEAMRVGHAVLILTEMAAAMERYDERHRKDFVHATRMNLAIARAFTSLDYLRAQRVRGEAMKEWDRVFSEVDVVMTPTTGCTAPYLDPRSEDIGVSDLETLTELMRFVSPGNLCGFPAISCPAGYDRAGLPIGLQIIGRHWDETLLLRMARVTELHVERRKPRVYFESPVG